MYYTWCKVFCCSVAILSFLHGIDCVERENELTTKTIQPRVGASGLARVASRESNVAPSPIIMPRRDGKIVNTKGRTVVFTLKKHPKTVLLREVRRPAKQVKRAPLHQRKGKQQTNAAVFNQQQQLAQQERLREQQAQQQRFLENQAQQQTIFTQNAFQPQWMESQRFPLNEQQAEQERLRQQAFHSAEAEQERKSYLEKKRREQNRRRRFPDGLSDQERLRNQQIMREKQHQLELRQAYLKGLADQQGLIAQQQNNFQQSQQLAGSASQQTNWFYHPQALANVNALPQLQQVVQQNTVQNERQVQSLPRIPKQRKQRPILGRTIVLRVLPKN